MLQTKGRTSCVSFARAVLQCTLPKESLSVGSFKSRQQRISTKHPFNVEFYLICVVLGDQGPSTNLVQCVKFFMKACEIALAGSSLIFLYFSSQIFGFLRHFASVSCALDRV